MYLQLYILFTVSLNKENGQHSTTSDLQKQDFLMAQSNTHQPNRSPSSLAFWKDVCTIPSVFTHPNFHMKKVLKNESLCLEAKHCIHSRTPLCNFFQLDLTADPTCQLWAVLPPGTRRWISHGPCHKEITSVNRSGCQDKLRPRSLGNSQAPTDGADHSREMLLELNERGIRREMKKAFVPNMIS